MGTLNALLILLVERELGREHGQIFGDCFGYHAWDGAASLRLYARWGCVRTASSTRSDVVVCIHPASIIVDHVQHALVFVLVNHVLLFIFLFLSTTAPHPVVLIVLCVELNPYLALIHELIHLCIFLIMCKVGPGDLVNGVRADCTEE